MKQTKTMALLIMMGFFSFQCDKIKEEAGKAFDYNVNRKLDKMVTKQCDRLKYGSSMWMECRKKIGKYAPKVNTK